MKSLFKVTKSIHPEWGHSSMVWSHYYLCSSKNKLEEILIQEYGSLSKWYSMDRCEERITIESLEVEEIMD